MSSNQKILIIVCIGLVLLIGISFFLMQGVDSESGSSASYVELLSDREDVYPVVVDVQQPEYAYNSPEDAVSSLLASLYNGNEDVFFNSMTADAKSMMLKSYEESNDSFEASQQNEKECKGYVLLDEVVYDDVVFVIVEKQYDNKPSFKFPVTIVLDDGKWKQTQKFSADQRMQEIIKKIMKI